MAQALNFQQVILKLHEFWAAQGCVIWEPYNVQVGAGTSNPATLLRALGPEPWRVAYVEPSIRPDDGRYGENPNRMQRFYQYQVILKPDTGNPQEVYLQSLEVLGINPLEHDIRFVEDNWENPSLGAWGLGWEVWLDGQEITQFTYFQQVGGVDAHPVGVEITYGLERIVLALQAKRAVWDIDWLPGLSYGDIMLNEEVEHCVYYFDVADVEGLQQVYRIYERESQRALAAQAVISAYDYLLKCSHLFNVLDTRGAIGVTERAGYFRSMREMARNIAQAYLAKREEIGYPLMRFKEQWWPTLPRFEPSTPPAPEAPDDVLLEIGVEEMPAQDVDAVYEQLSASAPALFDDLRLSHEGLNVMVTPRRIVIAAKQVAPRQPDEAFVAKGPPASRAFDADGQPTKAALGFARGRGVDVSALKVESIDGGEYVTAQVHQAGRSATEVLAEALPGLIAGLKFGKAMRWNETDVAFSRPIRWLVALYGQTVLPFQYAGVITGKVTRGLRPYGSPELSITDPGHYVALMAETGIYLSRSDRHEIILDQLSAHAESVHGHIPDDPGLLDEVVNLVEAPMAFLGDFDAKYLALPREVLVMVMRKHQRYFPLVNDAGALLPHFIAVRNGDREHIDKVKAGNEAVLRARFADAEFFYNEDRQHELASYLPRLGTLTFQEKLGSMLDKNQRVAAMVGEMGRLLGFDADAIAIAEEAAAIAKADLATQMVVEMTALQGIMGRVYALLEGRSEAVAHAIEEHWQPRGAGDALPASPAGTLLALTDRFDSLAGLFGAGLAPRATADPYGLRRAALGVVQLLVQKALDIDLNAALTTASHAQPLEVTEATRAQIVDFIKGRLDAWLDEDIGAPRDVINAVLAEQGANPYRARLAVAELQQWVAREDWPVILDNFARCVRITRAESQRYPVDPAHFVEDQERALYEAYASAAAQLSDDANVDAFLTAFTPLVPVIQAFFDHVLVNADDEAVKQNRLGLLQAISALQRGRADLSELTGF